MKNDFAVGSKSKNNRIYTEEETTRTSQKCETRKHYWSEGFDLRAVSSMKTCLNSSDFEKSCEMNFALEDIWLQQDGAMVQPIQHVVRMKFCRRWSRLLNQGSSVATAFAWLKSSNFFPFLLWKYFNAEVFCRFANIIFDLWPFDQLKVAIQE